MTLKSGPQLTVGQAMDQVKNLRHQRGLLALLFILSIIVPIPLAAFAFQQSESLSNENVKDLGRPSATYPYPMRWFTRQVTFVKPAHLIMYDELEAARPSMFSWLLHTKGNIEAREDMILVKGKRASLLINILSPTEWNYQILQDQKHMTGWERGEPIEYIKVGPAGKAENLRFLIIIVPQSLETDSTRFSVTRISQPDVLGVTLSRGRLIDTQLSR